MEGEERFVWSENSLLQVKTMEDFCTSILNLAFYNIKFLIFAPFKILVTQKVKFKSTTLYTYGSSSMMEGDHRTNILIVNI